MLIPGLKLGPKNWQDRIAANPKFVEIWYRVDQAENYQKMFEVLHQANIPFGLHFWAVTQSGHEPNLAYPGPDRVESTGLIQRCLEHAAAWQAVYVNIHSGNTRLMRFNLDNGWDMTPDETFPSIPDTDATTLRNQALVALGRYAHQVNVALLVELIPQATHTETERLHPIPEYPASLTGLVDLCQRQLIGFTNDFCHTFSMQTHQPRNMLYQQFLETTRTFVPFTKLCHINTLYEPYNGTDAHGGILPADFQQPGVFPTRQEYTELLRLLNQQPGDIFLVGEPSTDHVANYRALCDLLRDTLRGCDLNTLGG